MLHGPAEVLIRRSEAEGPVIPIELAAGEKALSGLAGPAAAFVGFNDFKGQAGRVLILPTPDGLAERVLYGLGAEAGATAMAMAVRSLPARLPAGDYELRDGASLGAEQTALAWALGSYAFDRYKAEHGKKRARLAVADDLDLAEVERIAHACALARDMVNAPANDMGPRQIESIAREIAEAFGAEITVCSGDALLEAGYPAVHAVGRAATAERAPRMIELRWSGAGEEAPLVAVVGKGVVFDTGGLDIKPSSGMRLMKKDMGGAAHALALARMVMAAKLPVRLAVLVPVAENAISGDAMRPGDVIASRKGLTIEVGNTDAEGRLILADALARAAELAPAVTIDLATLTGAARTALGPEVIPFYTADEALAGELADASREVCDPLWRMPLWPGYEGALDSDIADLKNDPDAWAQAGSVTAALFLQRFAPTTGAWLHLDIFAWNPKGRPGWPVGGEAQAIRALDRMLRQRYGPRA